MNRNILDTRSTAQTQSKSQSKTQSKIQSQNTILKPSRRAQVLIFFSRRVGSGKEREVVEVFFLSCYNELRPEHNLRISKRNYAFVRSSCPDCHTDSSPEFETHGCLQCCTNHPRECYNSTTECYSIMQMDCMSSKKRRQENYITSRCARIGSNHSHVKRRRIQFFTARNDGNSVQICRAFALSRTNEIWEPFAS